MTNEGFTCPVTDVMLLISVVCLSAAAPMNGEAHHTNGKQVETELATTK